ncbi:MAG: DNA polymerase III subunit delta' [Patescibacteria group bacterium]|jgi:DNA polymerase-3 subunit delta'|nr:DNA polymerase III subunit delta' [Patescibacteria group bacterium]
MKNDAKSKYKWPLIGNKKNIDFLSRGLANNKLTSSYIFSGPDNMGKTKLAEHFAKIILCEEKDTSYSEKPCGTCSSCKKFNSQTTNDNPEKEFAHGDFYIVKKEKDKKNISVEQVRDLIRSFGMSSFSDSYKVGIIKHADTLSESASNALLKILEEPRKKVVIILVSSNIDKMLTTIISRCQVLDFGPVEINKINKYLLDNYKLTRSAAKNYSRISLGRPALALKFIEDKEFYSNYTHRLDLLLDLIESGDINEKFSLVASMIDKKLSGLEASAVLKRLLETLQGVYRDLYLINYGLNNLVQNEIVDTRLKKMQVKNSINKITNILDEIEKSEDYIGANLSSKLILENITLSL